MQGLCQSRRGGRSVGRRWGAGGAWALGAEPGADRAPVGSAGQGGMVRRVRGHPELPLRLQGSGLSDRQGYWDDAGWLPAWAARFSASHSVSRAPAWGRAYQ